MAPALLAALTLGACAESEGFDARFDLSDADNSTDMGDDSDEDGGEDSGDGTSEEPPMDHAPAIPPDDTGDGDGDGDEDGGACLEFSDALAPVPPSVLFVLDRSGSMMTDSFDPQDLDKSRWQALYEAVEGTLLEDGLQGSMEVAAKTFSTKGWGACGVAPQLDVDFALDNAALLLDTIPGPSANVNGGTPTLEALSVSLDYMRDYEAAGSKVVVLITDGAIGCVDDQSAALEQIVGNLAGAREVDGIATYVIGIAPQYNSFKAQLQAMAAAGGTQDYLEADDAPALAAALTEVIEASYANSCLLDLGEAPSAPELTVVEVGGQAWPEVQGCADEDGWTWTNNELTRMQLCNAACDALLDTKEVTVEYHCDAG